MLSRNEEQKLGLPGEGEINRLPLYKFCVQAKGLAGGGRMPTAAAPGGARNGIPASQHNVVLAMKVRDKRTSRARFSS